MLQRHFGLRRDPFGLTPDPAFLFLSEGHAEALAGLKLGLLGRRGLIVLVGEVGTGKTTLLYSLLSGLGPEVQTAYVANTALPFDDILRAAVKDFGVPPAGLDLSGATRFELLEALNELLRGCVREGTVAALIIDEAQNLSDEAFEGLRLLLNFETYHEKLLQIILVGQPELDSRLSRPGLRQVADRIAIRCHLNPLTPDEARSYIDHRLRAAGSSSQIFTPAALKLAVAQSRGIPRRINVLCHNALLFAYGRDLPRADAKVMKQAVREREGRDLVRLYAAPVARVAQPQHRAAWGLRWLLALAGTAACGALLLGLFVPRPARTTHRPVPDTTPAATSAAAPATLPAVRAPDRPAAPAVTPPPEPVAGRLPEGDGDGARTLAVERGQTLSSLILDLYGRYDVRLLAEVLAENPQIRDPDLIEQGDRLRFPQPARGPSPEGESRP